MKVQRSVWRSAAMLLVAAMLTMVSAWGCQSDAPPEATPQVVLFTPDGTQLPALAGLTTVRVSVVDAPSRSVLSQSDFAYAEGGGALEGVPYGENLKMIVEGLDAQGQALLRGSSTPFRYDADGDNLRDVDGDGARDIPIFVSELDTFSPATALIEGADGAAVSPEQVFFQVAKKRVGHQAVLLPNGLVLITGGAVLSPDGAELPVLGGEMRAIEALDTVELYDPRSGRFFERPPMRQRRAFHTMTVLEDGRVLVTGGITLANTNDGRVVRTLASAEVFDPTRPGIAWRELDIGLEQGRAWHTATLRTADGQVVFVGGRRATDTGFELLASIEVFDPSVDRFVLNPGNTPIALDTPRAEHTATVLGVGRGEGLTVLVTGGVGPDGAPLASSEALLAGDAGLSVRAGPAMNTARRGHAAIGASPEDGNLILVVGGLDAEGQPIAGVEVLDTQGNVFVPVAQLAQPRAYMALMELPQTQDAIVIGGLSLDGRPAENAERLTYDPATGRYVAALMPSRMVLPRLLPGAVLMDNGLVLVTGGATLSGGAWSGIEAAEFFNADDGPPPGSDPLDDLLLSLDAR